MSNWINPNYQTVELPGLEMRVPIKPIAVAKGDTIQFTYALNFDKRPSVITEVGMFSGKSTEQLQREQIVRLEEKVWELRRQLRVAERAKYRLARRAVAWKRAHGNHLFDQACEICRTAIWYRDNNSKWKVRYKVHTAPE